MSLNDTILFSKIPVDRLLKVEKYYRLRFTMQAFHLHDSIYFRSYLYFPNLLDKSMSMPYWLSYPAVKTKNSSYTVAFTGGY